MEFMDDQIAKLNAEFKEFETRMAELRRQQVAAVDAFGKRAVAEKIRELRAKIDGYGDDRFERDN